MESGWRAGAARAQSGFAWRAGAVAALAATAIAVTAVAGSGPASGAATRPAAAASPSPSASPSPTSLPRPAPSPGPVAVPYPGTPAVGALLAESGGRLRHYCTAAVVKSPAGDLAVTAGHCLQGRRLGPAGSVIFAPGYHSGRFPYGKWTVTKAFTDTAWRKDRDVNDDVAFFTVAQDGRRIQKYTGAETLRAGVSLPQHVEVIGYPDTGTRPVRCFARARRLTKKGYQQLVFDCRGFPQGTSGGPFLLKTRRAEEIIGVIGGYQRGGDSSSVSYSSRFLANVAALYRRAIS
jgi:V8-like Glu-specific endopeptidase